ncbi:MAG: response regulator transcription factor [Tannerellaceae bacterium]|jgi:DNA-binding response OmpR family regulator|nr:response regulator transcription factor [Tannerellaceae bacterium]
MAKKEHFKILLFEKNESIGQLLCEFMQMSDFRADMFTDPEEACQAFTTGKYPICIINLEASSLEEDFSLVKKIKSINPDVILIFLATNPGIEVITQAYALEADDFIRKPFILEELQMRITAIIRRARVLEVPSTPIYQIGKYVFDSKKQTLTLGEVCNKITTKECELLKYLCENMNLLVLREEVLRTVWRNNSYYNARSMDVYITKLRRLLKDDNRVGIVNVHGKGYKLLVI